MAYNRPWLSFEDQLALLKDRGLIIDDDSVALDYLDRLGYYRLSAYWYPFRRFELQQDNEGHLTGYTKIDQFMDNSRFRSAVELYAFDKKLRLLAMDALERIEVAVRVDVAHLLGRRNPFAYLDPTEFQPKFTGKGPSGTDKTWHQIWLEKYDSAIDRSKERFVEHYKNNHGLPLPIWVAIELWDFGLLSSSFLA